MLKRTSDFKIIRTRFLNEENFVLDLLCPDEECDFNPGQFVNVSVEHSKTTFLRRPISVHDFRKSENILSLFVQIVGDGTRQLSL
ncbi:MAG: dihydroorotate dehydrogenase electron transfer subunit, partial [Bacteroidales bacterium]|nr:dihydroorotate dehydrogenase electron transfer subunit [Bacteroidales bacterium]